jgi:hypothetical protein
MSIGSQPENRIVQIKHISGISRPRLKFYTAFTLGSGLVPVGFSKYIVNWYPCSKAVKNHLK